MADNLTHAIHLAAAEQSVPKGRVFGPADAKPHYGATPAENVLPPHTSASVWICFIFITASLPPHSLGSIHDIGIHLIGDGA